MESKDPYTLNLALLPLGILPITSIPPSVAFLTKADIG
jgi:hypothetical protein